MANIRTVTWPLDPHTGVKHELLRRYLGAWFGIMSRSNNEILFVDGFAGPGEYTGGEPGSPIVALRTAAGNVSNCKLKCVFIEEHKKRHANLTRVIAEELQKQPLPSHVSYRALHGEFADLTTRALDGRARKGKALEPAFVFIDPFGYSGIPMRIIARIMSNARCEVFITCMTQFVNRFLSLDAQAPHLDDLFGTSAWREVQGITEPRDRKRFLHDLYKAQLHTVANVKYVQSFEMFDSGNQSEYFLFYGTNNLLGLSKMKEAMWKADPAGGVSFTDLTNPDQIVLIEPEPDLARLEALILDLYSFPMEATVAHLDQWILTETAFRETHLHKVLRQMKREGKIIRRDSTSTALPPDAVVLFMDRSDWGKPKRSRKANSAA